MRFLLARMDLTRSASSVFDPASLWERTAVPLVASFSREGPPLQRRSKVRVQQRPLRPELDFPITQSARRDLLRFKQFALAVSQISASCPEFRTGASISGKNRWFQTIASRVIGEIVVRIPTAYCQLAEEDSAIIENTQGSISDFRTKLNPCGQNS